MTGSLEPPPSGRMTAKQLWVVGLCSLVAFLDGFDTHSVGPAARDIATEMSVATARFGWLSSTFGLVD